MSEGMHPEDIKAAIRKRGTTMKDLSLKWGFSESAISKSLTDPMPFIEPMIAKFIGKKLYQIWPDRYDRENIRIRPVSNRNKSSVKQRASHCKKLARKFTEEENANA